ncbi:COR domain-containing protein [Candidatus Bathycorpusculum sp.]|uniref:COR domain-containing protein n=1 Tax=Candidatus Bathycorpusculum sp. TaxID=2994959 RepID=UPI002819A73C|nr:ADP-ribosylation factor-like protein [Candidatus Termitimicrobium sp.]MCL2685629.1 ADP-ribosylation factor-like protein [Candidatus Termitimicrobium sp.]
MDKEFLDKIQESLSGFALKDVCFFAWLCAVRALPFLAIRGNFDYWKHTNRGDQRQKYLFTILKSLDIVANAYNYETAASADTRVDVAVAVRATAAYADTRAIDAAVRAVAAAVRVATVDDFAFTYDAPDTVATDAADAAVEAFAFGGSTIDLKAILIEDLRSIKSGNNAFRRNLAVYGDLWGNFQSALCKLGCEYWGKWYTSLFKKGLVLDNEDYKEIQARLKVPAEIMEQGAAAVARYLKEAEKQGGLVYAQRETRLILLGSASAGKTTLARRLNGTYSDPTPEESTHGVNTEIELDFNGVKTRVWDFGGQVIYHASHRCFMSANCVYILVVNAREEECRDISRLNYWLDTIRIYSENKAKAFIVINESDNRSQNLEDFSSFMEGEYKSIIHKFYSFNICKDVAGFDAFKKDLTAYIESVGHQAFGKNDSRAMCEVTNLFKQTNKKILKKNELEAIFSSNGIKKHDQKRVVELFDTLGVALSYAFMEDYVLDPCWISRGVYKVIDYLQKNKTGLIKYSEDVFDAVFADESSIYPKGEREHIFDLMEHHKIGFRNKGGIYGLLVPCAAARFVPTDVINSAKPDSLITHVERDTLDEIPADFFNRYLCKNENNIATREEGSEKRIAVWQEGMVLAGNNASATVLIYHNRRIEITVWGEEKEAYRDMLEARIDDLLKDYNFSAIKDRKERNGKIINFIGLVLSRALQPGL